VRLALAPLPFQPIAGRLPDPGAAHLCLGEPVAESGGEFRNRRKDMIDHVRVIGCTLLNFRGESRGRITDPVYSGMYWLRRAAVRYGVAVTVASAAGTAIPSGHDRRRGNPLFKFFDFQFFDFVFHFPYLNFASI
jgi:hypothetical protein